MNSRKTLGTPILMYHKVGAPVASPNDRFLNVSQRNFARQMQAISRLGYRAITFSKLAHALESSSPLPRRSFTVTFDDGYQCVADFAAPVLAKCGWPATIFVVSGYAGKSNAWDEEAGLPVLPLMDWPQLLHLQSEGWEISGHTMSHPKLDLLDEGEARRELQESKQQIEEKIGQAITTFCYPYGRLSRRTPELVRDAGYRAACTTRSGIANIQQDRWLLPRVKVASRDGVAGLLYRLYIRPLLP